MSKETYNVIGVMSGTSLDGIDLAHVFFSMTSGKWAFELGQCETIPYSPSWFQALQTAVALTAPELAKLDAEYTLLLGNIINGFIERHRLSQIDAICSHGHTILHQPQNGFTLQIGNQPGIASMVSQLFVCDFRVQDVELGGQGAPLVPIGDRMLFAGYAYCLNLGGFSNISFEKDGNRIAFDVSAVNTVLNFYANTLGHDYDKGGHISRGGMVHEKLLSRLDALDFYSRPYPKSLGFEYVKEVILPLIETYAISAQDKLRTFTEHIAIQLAAALENKDGKLLVTGGGAYNAFLIERIQSLLPEMTIIIPESKILEYKEALIFALLGVLKLRGETNVLSSVTGARQDHSSGKIYHPLNKS